MISAQVADLQAKHEGGKRERACMLMEQIEAHVATTNFHKGRRSGLDKLRQAVGDVISGRGGDALGSAARRKKRRAGRSLDSFGEVTVDPLSLIGAARVQKRRESLDNVATKLLAAAKLAKQAEAAEMAAAAKEQEVRGGEGTRPTRPSKARRRVSTVPRTRRGSV